MDYKEMMEKLEKEMEIMSTPIDFEQLEQEGLLKKIGNSYYTNRIHDLPEFVRKKIKSFSTTKKGLKLTFYK